MPWIKVDRGDMMERMHYEERDDGWYVDGELFADKAANSRMVKQLIRKEYDVRY